MKKWTNQKLEFSLTFITGEWVWLPKDIKQIGLHKVQILLRPLPALLLLVMIIYCFVLLAPGEQEGNKISEYYNRKKTYY